MYVQADPATWTQCVPWKSFVSVHVSSRQYPFVNIRNFLMRSWKNTPQILNFHSGTRTADKTKQVVCKHTIRIDLSYSLWLARRQLNHEPWFRQQTKAKKMDNNLVLPGLSMKSQWPRPAISILFRKRTMLVKLDSWILAGGSSFTSLSVNSSG